MKVKEESEKAGLKLNIQKTKIMASGPITSWQIDRETMETVTDLVFWGSKITADGDCSHETKRRLLLGRKAMTKLDSILKNRDITLPTPTPRAQSNPCPSSRCCHPTISSSVIPFSSRLQSFPTSGSFPISHFFTSGGQSVGASASTSVLPMNIQY